METPLISIIIPVYNAGKFLDKCLKSIFLQTLNNFEVILINDGSEDNSYEIMLKYKQKYKDKIKIISQGNMGISVARNMGISQSKGEYIAFVDSDDFVDPDYLQLLYKNAKKNNADISCCNYYKYFNKTGRKYAHVFKMSKGVYSNKKALKILISDNRLQYYLWNKLFKRSLLVKNHITFTNICFEDTEFCVKSFYFANKIAVIGKPLYYYVKHSSSTIADLNLSKLNDYLQALASTRIFLEKNQDFSAYKFRYFLHSLRILNSTCKNIISKQKLSSTSFKNIVKSMKAIKYYNSKQFKQINSLANLKPIF